MKTLLSHNFYQPYYIYDNIEFYNKITKKLELRRRVTAISFSDEKEIAIAFLICSPLDNYSKSVAKYGNDKTIGLENKLIKLITDIKEPTNEGLDVNNVFYFKNIEDYISKVDFLARYAKTNIASDFAFLNSDIENANYYFHQKYVLRKYVTFFSKLEEWRKQSDGSHR